MLWVLCFSVFRMLQRRKNSKYRIKGDNPSFDSGYVWNWSINTSFCLGLPICICFFFLIKEMITKFFTFCFVQAFLIYSSSLSMSHIVFQILFKSWLNLTQINIYHTIASNYDTVYMYNLTLKILLPFVCGKINYTPTLLCML